MRHTFNLFSDYFSRRDNRLRRLDVRVKLGLAVMSFAVVLGSTQPVLPLLVWMFSLSGMVILRIPVGIVVRRFLPSLMIALVILFVQSFLLGKTPVFSWTCGSWTLTVMREGLVVGFRIASHVLGAVGILLLLSSVTPAHELFLALRWCRLPAVWVEIAMLMYRYLFVCLDEASELVDAQRVRLGYAKLGTALSSAGGLIGAVLVRSIEQSFRTHEAMVARGYTGEYPFAVMPRMTRKSGFLLLAGVGIIGLIFVVAERGLG